MEEGPRPTGQEYEVKLTDMLLPFFEGQPALLQVPGSADFYLPIFWTEEDLKVLMKRAGAPYDKIKLITDGMDFLDSIPKNIKIAVNIRFTPEGKVRWTEVKR